MPDTLQSGQSFSQASTPSMQSATFAARGDVLLPDVTLKHVDHCRLEDTSTDALPHMLHEARMVTNIGMLTDIASADASVLL